VSAVFDLGPHDFSILRYWLGELWRGGNGVGTRAGRSYE
jgi:hypothetical protein